MLILGMHRSGTSAITRLVSMLGASLPKRMLGANPGNEAGHWEPERLIAYHDQMLAGLGSNWHDWAPLDLKTMAFEKREQIAIDIGDIIAEDFGFSPLFVVKEPRIARFAGFFCQALAQRAIGIKAIVMFRNPLDVIDSLMARQTIWPADHDRSDAALLWLSHTLDTEHAARGLPHAFASYEAIMADPVSVMERLVGTLGLDTPISVAEAASDMAAFVSDGHRHHAHAPDEVLLDPQLSGWVAECYSALRDLEASRNLSGARETLDRIRQEFHSAMPLLTTTTAARRKALAEAQSALQRATQSEAQSQQLMSERAALTDEMERAKNDYETQIAGKDSQLQSATAAEQDLRESLSVSQAALSEARDAAQDALGRAEAIEARFVQAQAEMEDLRREIAEAQSQLAAQTEGGEQTRQALAEAEARKADLSATLEQLRAEHAAELGAARDTMDAHLREKDAEIADSLAQAEQTRQALAEAEARKAELSATLEQLRAEYTAELRAARDAMDAHLREKDAEIADSLAQVEHTRQALAKAEARKAELSATLEQLRAEYTAELRAARQLMDERLAEKDAEIAGFLTQVEEIRETLANAQAREAQWQIKLTESEELAARQAALLGEREERIVALSSEAATTNAQADQLGAMLANTHAELAQRVAELSAANEQKEQISARLRQSDAALAARSQEVGLTRLSLEAALAQVEATQREFLDSTSWRITAPLRRTKMVARGIGRFPGRLLRGISAIPAALRFGGGLMPSIGKATRVYRTEGLSGFRWRMDHAVRMDANQYSNSENSGSAFKQSDLLPPSSPAQPPVVQDVPRKDETNAYIQQVLSTAKKAPGIDLEFVPKSPQRFDLSDCPVKTIAFYLPQFHPIPENDKWWGTGFTEWTNVSKAVPQYVGHYQPHLPGELGFYDLRVVDTQRQQAALAKHYGIYGFCYHHYWFGGKRLLEKPVNQILANPDIDLPFCLCWANENWTRRWDGMDQDVLMAQNHSPEDDLAFIADLAPAFRDPRYIRFKGRPVLLVYRISLLPDAKATAQRWRDYCKSEGIGDLYLVAARTFGIKDPAAYGFDAAIEFPPHEANARCLNEELDFVNKDFSGYVFSYEDMVSSHLSLETPNLPHIKTVSPGWDNEARKPGKGHVFHGSNPSNYAKWLRAAVDFTIKRCKTIPDQPPFVFINAWNEWAEGAYLEPDRRYGYANLHATANVLMDYAGTAPDITAAIEASQAAFTPRSKGCLILHLYYTDLYDEILPYLRNAGDLDIFISLNRAIDIDMVNRIRADFPHAYLAIFNNRGRDIMPFTRLLKLIRSLGYEYGCKIHSKKSLQREDGAQLRQGALDSLLGSRDISNENRARIQTDASVGILAPKNSILDLNVPDRNVLNRTWLDKLLASMKRSDLVGSYPWTFAAGSMFWFKVEALAPLTELALQDSDFEEELGQVDGTLAHALERVAGLCVIQSGYSLRTVEEVK
ncbi:glycoside hydrolase family 99-like domain-containing protein [Hoeflea sp.]|uniref:glycoside hydrolase family 99-like domain-containing protein n=1 Tax=Hoeflea sp. TaxID=1940281 RepID=UPI0019CBB36E|nr:glycoside hydrolase family 99-like domain-containing protein [Hoeflea sp.]MBC7284277.1 glycoside hydrolase family 99-like domain-containing protein [Hoeflea sp.]